MRGKAREPKQWDIPGEGELRFQTHAFTDALPRKSRGLPMGITVTGKPLRDLVATDNTLKYRVRERLGKIFRALSNTESGT